MYEFDKTDIKIVNFLLEDGRMTASEMSRRMGDISERAIRYRIDRMIQEGVIQISAVINPEALGFKIKADVWLEVEADMVLEVAKKMASFDNVTYVACGIGQNDISIQLAAYDTSEIYYFVTEVVRKVPGAKDHNVYCADRSERCLPVESARAHNKGIVREQNSIRVQIIDKRSNHVRFKDLGVAATSAKSNSVGC